MANDVSKRDGNNASTLIGIDSGTGEIRAVQVDSTGHMLTTGSGGGGGGGAVTIADGADTAQGTTTDTSTANTVIGRLKKLISLLPTALGSTNSAGSFPVVVASDQAAIPITSTTLATVAKQPALGTAGTASTDVITVQGIASGTVIPVTATTLPLPTGAATSAKQPALGTAGSASTDVITVQGIASGIAQPASQSGTWTVQPGNTANITAWKVDGSAVTQPVSLATSINQKPANLTTVAVGELAGSTSALQMPSVACTIIRFKAAAANAGKVYIGITGVTKVDGTTDTTTGLQMSAGDDTGWMPTDNANRFFRICDNAGDALTYMAMT